MTSRSVGAVTVVVEFVAGPRCGEVETVEHWSDSLQPPLTLDLPSTPRRRGAVYRRRDSRPDPRTDRWIFDHVPPDEYHVI
jgi:predicted component of type VI protein secretion system